MRVEGVTTDSVPEEEDTTSLTPAEEATTRRKKGSRRALAGTFPKADLPWPEHNRRRIGEYLLQPGG
jgi:hypothetical protein